MSPERRDKIARLESNRQKNMELYTELTMIEEAAKDLCVPLELIKVKKTNEGKPYIEGFENYHISVSHCDGIIMFAGHSSPIGVDIEKKRNNYIKLAKRFFTTDEYLTIKKAPLPGDEFLLVWTRKEACVKLTGQGLKTPLDSFDVYTGTTYIYQTDTYTSNITGEKYVYSTAVIKNGAKV